MGLFGGGNSSSSTSNVSNQYDQRTAAGDQAIAIGPGSSYIAGLDNNEVTLFSSLVGSVDKLVSNLTSQSTATTTLAGGAIDTVAKLQVAQAEGPSRYTPVLLVGGLALLGLVVMMTSKG